MEPQIYLNHVIDLEVKEKKQIAKMGLKFSKSEIGASIMDLGFVNN